MVSFLFGFITYRSMFQEFNPALWIFIPDCPLYVGFLLLVVFFGVRSRIFRFITSVGLMKYGMWTLMIFALYPDVYFAEGLAFQTWILVAGHTLMALAPFIIVPGRPAPQEYLPALAWFLLNDYMDYWVGTKPVFPETHIGLVIIASIALSIFPVVILCLINRLREIGIFKRLRRELGVKG